MSAVPKISCLTVTRDRPARLRRAVDHFRRQTWPSKEMVVVVDRRGSLDWVEPFVREHGGDDLRVLVPPLAEHLGALRNAAVDAAAGEVVATWDDDDLYHPRRLEDQARAMLAEDAPVCFVREYLQYMEDSGDLFLESCDTGLSPSLLCAKAVLPRYEDRITDAARGEKGSDRLVNDRLASEQRTAFVSGKPYLYAYVFHGRNVWHQTHHVNMAFSLNLRMEAARPLLPGLSERLREYFPAPIPDAVLCNGGERIALA